MLAIISIVVLALILPQHTGHCNEGKRDNSMMKRYNFMDGAPCRQMCSEECGGICFFNMMTFSHQCNCAFKRSLG